jgi:cytochrome c peroxidase
LLFGPLAWAEPLSRSCPKYFELRGRRCYLQTAYQQFDSKDQDYGFRLRLEPIIDGLSPEMIDLGRLLFFDPILSKDRTLSCAHCHDPRRHWTDGKAQALGASGRGVGIARQGGQRLRRSTPPLWNLNFRTKFFFDGRARTLEEQLSGPLDSAEEMGGSAQMREARLNQLPEYRQKFGLAFGIAQEMRISDQMVRVAIATFERTLISLNSRFDRFVLGADHWFSQDEIRGLNVFRSFVSRCSECHAGPLFTNGEFARIGVPVDGSLPDRGMGEHHPAANAVGAFLVPTLRNIAETSPYMHAGQFQTLREVVQFYNRGGNVDRPFAVRRSDIHWHVREAGLSEADIDALVAFLGTLSDASAAPKVPGRVPSGLPVLR